MGKYIGIAFSSYIDDISQSVRIIFCYFYVAFLRSRLVIVVTGNKSDLKERRQVSEKEGKKLI